MHYKYPDLSHEKIIAFDLETYDPELKEKGPGVYRKDGYILGCSFATLSGFSEYYNVGHPGITQEEKENNYKYIADVLKLPNMKVGANILYDLDWIMNWKGFEVNGEYNDIQVAEPLLDENKRKYRLDSLAQFYLGKGKQITEINKFCTEHNLKGSPQNWLWKMPASTVRPYGKADAEETIQIYIKQVPKLRAENLYNLYKMEIGILPLLLQMRRNGVRIDKHYVNKQIGIFTRKIHDYKEIINKKYYGINYNSSKQIAYVLDKMGIKYGLTEKGNPNLDKDALETLEDDTTFIQTILEVKEMDKILNTFLINAFTGHNVAGRLHTQFHPMATDDYGTKSGRFSSTNPNLQQIPGQDKTYKEECRSCLIPEEGHWWGKHDWSQIEYRFIAHYAKGPKSEEVREKYNNDPKTDYHAMVMEWTGVDRPNAKRLNFGAAYAMGASTCSRKFKWSYEDAVDLLEKYHEEVPFVRYTRNEVIKVARGRGYIKTILNRRARVTKQIREARKEYSFFNRLIQGSAADLMKKAMYDCYKAGIYNTLVPHLTVHDELDVSIPKTKEGIEAFKEQKYIMENCIKLKVPIIADAEVGNNWYAVSEHQWEEIRDYNGGLFK